MEEKLYISKRPDLEGAIFRYTKGRLCSISISWQIAGIRQWLPFCKIPRWQLMYMVKMKSEYAFCGIQSLKFCLKRLNFSFFSYSKGNHPRICLLPTRGLRWCHCNFLYMFIALDETSIYFKWIFVDSQYKIMLNSTHFYPVFSKSGVIKIVLWVVGKATT